jgi:hypothetical protein
MRFMTAMTAAAFVLAAANAAPAAPIQLSQAKPKETPVASQTQEGKKGAPMTAEQNRREMKDKDQTSGSSPTKK